MKTLDNILKHPLYLKHKEKVKFMAVGVGNTVLDFLLYGVLANLVGLPAVVANTVSVTICIIVSFVLNTKFVWQSKKTMKKTLVPFFAVSIFSGWVIQGGGIWLVTSLLSGWWIFGTEWFSNLFAKAVACSVALVFNYLGYKYIFTDKKVSLKEASPKLS
jgi:putative flippase GtrA